LKASHVYCLRRTGREERWVVVPFAGNRHPEFGYLCPSARPRRKLRRMAVVAALALMAGASSTAVRVGYQDMGHQDTDPLYASALAPPDLMAAPQSTPATYVPVVPVASETKSRATQTTAAACREATWRYADGACGSGKTRKMRVVRIPVERPPIAARPIGRAEGAPVTAEPTNPLVTIPRIADTSADSAKPADGMPPDPVSVEAVPASKPKAAPAASTKKVRSMADHHQAPRRGVYASSPSYDYQYRASRFYNPWRRTVFW
jgi:hypothetical protein